MGLFDHFVPPAGLVPAGPYTAPEPSAPIEAHVFLADKIRSDTLDLESVLAGRHPLDAWVLTQLAIWRGSGAAVLDEGQNFAAIRKVDDQTSKRIAFEVERVLQPAIDRGALKILTIVVRSGEDEGAPADDFASAYVEYQNLLRPDADPERAPLPEG